MGESHRKTGLEFIGDISWGTHLCYFYQSKEDFTEIVLAYVKAGLENNEKCVWVTSPFTSSPEAKALLEKNVADLSLYFDRSQIEITDYEGFYFKNGQFGLRRLLEEIIALMQQSQKTGFSGLRLVFDLSWLTRQDWLNFMDYEEELNEVLCTQKVLSMCVYSLDTCSPVDSVDVASKHQYAVARRDGNWEMIEVNERKLAEDFLRDNENKYQTIFETTCTATIILEENTTISLANKEFEKMSGYSKAELMGKKSLFDFVSGEECAMMMREYHRLRRIDPNLAPRYYEAQFVDRFGKIKDIFVTVDMIPGTKKSVAAILDISKHKQIEKKLELLNRKLLASNRTLKQLALRDPHTGLYNHRYIADVIEAEFFRAKRYAHSLSAVSIDLDYFKSINDVYGHKFGDVVLGQFGKQLKRMVRPYDIVIRSGGEEFLIISPGTDRQKAVILAQRILDAISLYNFGNKKHIVKLKLSIAVASYPEDKALKGMDLVGIGEHILNKAKESGGNRVYSSLDIASAKAVSPKKKREERDDIRKLKEKIDKISRQANQNSVEAVFAFAKTIELKDHCTGEHVERTVHYATELANALHLPKDEVELIRQSAILHDLGKIGVSEKILLKKSKLSKNEFDEIKKHPQIGVDIIRPIQYFHKIIPIMLYHHERWDGKGYPNGLKGEEIPVGARIVCMADVYQALTSDRPYRKALSKEKALQIIKEGAGTMFDPSIVNVFLKIVEKERK